METKRNQKYFAAKGINPVMIVGLVIILAGIVLLTMANTRTIGIVILLVGGAVAVFGSGAKAGEYDIDNQIYGITKEMPEQAMIKYEVYERHFLSIIKPIFLKGFDFSPKDVYCKKGSDHIYRTNVYNAAQLYFAKTKIYVYGKHITLTDASEEANYEFGGSYPYEDVEKAYIEEKKFPVQGKEISVYYFGLKLKSGEDAFKFTVEYGADVDKAADDINHTIEKMTEKAEEREKIKASKRAALRAEVEKETAEKGKKDKKTEKTEDAAPAAEDASVEEKASTQPAQQPEEAKTEVPVEEQAAPAEDGSSEEQASASEDAESNESK